MAAKERKWVTFFLAVFIGLIAGALISELLGLILPTGVVKDFLITTVNFGFEPVLLNIGAIKFTFGLSFSFTVVSFLIVIAMVYYFKWWL